MDVNKKDQGLIAKFEVKRLAPSTRGIDHNDCRYFVLDPKHDLIARAALVSYASRARLDGYEELYQDLMDWVQELDNADEAERIRKRLEDLQ